MVSNRDNKRFEFGKHANSKIAEDTAKADLKEDSCFVGINGTPKDCVINVLEQIPAGSESCITAFNGLSNRGSISNDPKKKAFGHITFAPPKATNITAMCGTSRMCRSTMETECNYEVPTDGKPYKREKPIDLPKLSESAVGTAIGKTFSFISSIIRSGLEKAGVIESDKLPEPTSLEKQYPAMVQRYQCLKQNALQGPMQLSLVKKDALLLGQT